MRRYLALTDDEIYREKSMIDQMKNEYNQLLRQVDALRFEEDQIRSKHKTHQIDLQDSWDKLSTLRTHISNLRTKIDEVIEEDLGEKTSFEALLYMAVNQEKPSNAFIINSKLRLRDELIEQMKAQEMILKELRQQISNKAAILVHGDQNNQPSTVNAMDKSIDESIRMRENLVRASKELEKAEENFISLSIQLDHLKKDIKESSADDALKRGKAHMPSPRSSEAVEPSSSSSSNISLQDALSGQGIVVRMSGEVSASFRKRMEKRLRSLMVLESELQSDLDERANCVRHTRDAHRELELLRLRLELQMSGLERLRREREQGLMNALDDTRMSSSTIHSSGASLRGYSEGALSDMRETLRGRYGGSETSTPSQSSSSARLLSSARSPVLSVHPYAFDSSSAVMRSHKSELSTCDLARSNRRVIDSPRIDDEVVVEKVVDRLSENRQRGLFSESDELPSSPLGSDMRSLSQSTAEVSSPDKAHVIKEADKMSPPLLPVQSKCSDQINRGAHVKEPVEVFPVNIYSSTQETNPRSVDSSLETAVLGTPLNTRFSVYSRIPKKTQSRNSKSPSAAKAATPDDSVQLALTVTAIKASASIDSPSTPLRNSADRSHIPIKVSAHRSSSLLSSKQPCISPTPRVDSEVVNHHDVIISSDESAKTPADISKPSSGMSSSEKSYIPVRIGKYSRASLGSPLPSHMASLISKEMITPFIDCLVDAAPSPEKHSNEELESSVNHANRRANIALEAGIDHISVLQSKYLNRALKESSPRAVGDLRKGTNDYDLKMKISTDDADTEASRLAAEPCILSLSPPQSPKSSVSGLSVFMASPKTTRYESWSMVLNKKSLSPESHISESTNSRINLPTYKAPYVPIAVLRSISPGKGMSSETSAIIDSFDKTELSSITDSLVRHESLHGLDAGTESKASKTIEKSGYNLCSIPEPISQAHSTADAYIKDCRNDLNEVLNKTAAVSESGNSVIDTTVNPLSFVTETGSAEENGFAASGIPLCSKRKGSKLSVTIMEARNLPAMKRMSKSADPFVDFYFGLDSSKHYRTAVQWGTLSPSWIERFDVYVDDMDCLIHFSVMDASKSGDSESIGNCEVKVSSAKGKKQSTVILPLSLNTRKLKNIGPTNGGSFLKIQIKFLVSDSDMTSTNPSGNKSGCPTVTKVRKSRSLLKPLPASAESVISRTNKCSHYIGRSTLSLISVSEGRFIMQKEYEIKKRGNKSTITSDSGEPSMVKSENFIKPQSVSYRRLSDLDRPSSISFMNNFIKSFRAY